MTLKYIVTLVKFDYNKQRTYNIRDEELFLVPCLYTKQTGLPVFDSAAVTANGNWYYASALNPVRGNQTFRCRLVNIGSNYKQYVSKSCVWAPKSQKGQYFCAQNYQKIWEKGGSPFLAQASIRNPLPTSGIYVPCVVRNFVGIPAVATSLHPQ